jgi:alpha-beta hydrolase superfamily lysophospholipase
MRRTDSTAVAAALAILLAALGVSPRAASQRVTFRTDDGVAIAATWHDPDVRPAAAVILVHMLHRTRRDWDAVASRLADEGIGALAIDLRGHGDSGGSVRGDDDGGYGSMVRDVSAARRYLASRGDVQGARIGILGASVGANLAALAATDDIASLALLSPSLDYRGLRIEAAVRKYGRPVLFVASDDDPYAMRSTRDLQKNGGGAREAYILSRAGHGTMMLDRDHDLARRLVDWFRRTL